METSKDTSKETSKETFEETSKDTMDAMDVCTDVSTDASLAASMGTCCPPEAQRALLLALADRNHLREHPAVLALLQVRI